MRNPSGRIPLAPRYAVLAVAIVAGAALGLVALSSCSSRPHPEVPLAATGKPALHAVSNAELRKAMAELNRQVTENIRLEAYTGNAPARDMSAVAQAAASMVATAERIPEAVPTLNLNEPEREIFLKLAAKLRDEANTLHSEARRNDRAAAEATANRMVATCNACHTSFRLSPVSSR